MFKRRVFIGSSSEELVLARRASDLLSNTFDVTVWDDTVWDTSVFRINQNFLSDLLKASLKFDFGILIGTQDDKVVVRGKEVMKPRDNILFELGLFTGRLGTSKCAFIIDKNIELLSDLQGITLPRFDQADLSTFDEAVRRCEETFMAHNESEINFFPSATLASVYFENFVKPICSYIISNNGIHTETLDYEKCVVSIIIPDKINDDVNLQFQQMKKKMQTTDESVAYAGRPRNIIIDTTLNNNVLEVVDFPTILKGINHSISNLLPNEFNRLSNDYDVILDRELRRFITTLKSLIIRAGFDEMVFVKRESDI